ncbi:MAG: ABC transporter substrate-binding protein [Firmicutes bacterium]|jgi:branched-chain amino acid transport system substrate-binding protein|nr:ABC transporter substrate-binding protein [Bacillota bacterium]
MKRFAVILAILLVAFGSIAHANEPIVIGFITALTGSTSLWGTQEANGAMLRAEEINAAGGVLGRPLKLIVYDHKGSPQEGVLAYRRLVDEDKAVAVLGTHFSNISLAIAPVAEQKKVPVLGQAVEPKVTIPAPGKLNKYHFLAQPSCIEQGQMMARFAFEELGARKAAVLADKSNSYSISQAEHFAEYFKRRGGEVTDFVEYAAGTVDYRAHLTQIKAGSPEVIFLPQYAQPGGMQVKQAKELGIEATFLGSNSLSDPPFVAAAGGAENVAGLYFLFNVNWSEPKFEAFINNYEAKYGEKPVTYHSLFGYDDVTLICEAIKNAGAAEPEAIRTAIEGLTDVPIMLGDGKFTMDAETHRTRNMPSWIMQWNEAGEIVPVQLVYPPAD